MTPAGLGYRTWDAVKHIARWQLGYAENPANSNKTKYGADFGLNGQPWCQIFVWWCMKEAGFSGFYKGGGSCTAVVKQYKQNAPKQVITSGFQPGDILYFDFSGKKSKTEHVGFCIGVSTDGSRLTTIEGNTAPTLGGSQSNGGMVCEKTRASNLVTCAIRPNYKG